MDEDVPEIEVVEFDAVDVIAQLNEASLSETKGNIVHLLVSMFAEQLYSN